jgi:hypothetical protein
MPSSLAEGLFWRPILWNHRLMPMVLLLAWLAQPSACTADTVSALADAGRRARAFDLAGAVNRLQDTPEACETSRLALLYLRGLRAAREAYRNGGDEVSLAPVTESLAAIDPYVAGNPRAEVLQLTLMAAAAAAQSERGDMLLLLEQATALEKRLVGGGSAGAPGVTAHEAAGDLWLQVHRFDAARAAYQEAAAVSGSSPRISLGLARVAVRLHDDTAACAAYRLLTMQWSRSEAPPELVEARTFLADPRCGAAATGK